MPPTAFSSIIVASHLRSMLFCLAHVFQLRAADQLDRFMEDAAMKSTNNFEPSFMSKAWEIATGAIGLAELAHFDPQVVRNDFLKITQGLAYLPKHACASRFAEELRHSEHIVASFDLHTEVI
jgi:hypothetical protein